MTGRRSARWSNYEDVSMTSDPWEEMTRRWREMYQEHASLAQKNFLDGQAQLATALGGGAVSEALRRMAEGPRLADVGTSQRLIAKVMKLWLSVQDSARTYESVVSGAWAQANTRFVERLSQRYGTGTDMPDAKESLKLWLDVANQVLLETHRSEKFLDAQRQLLRSGMDFMLAEREFVEALVEPAGLPTRTEIDEVHRSIHELKRRVKTLERASATTSLATTSGSGSTDVRPRTT